MVSSWRGQGGRQRGERERERKERIDIMSERHRIVFQNIANKYSNGKCCSSMRNCKARRTEMEVICRTRRVKLGY